MKVLVTGGTGYVGSHTVAALCRAGHQVRVLARRPEQVPLSLDPLGVTADEVVVGDVVDPTVVARAVDGCDAVVHAAAVYSLAPSAAAEVAGTNVRATELVLGTAVDAGLDRIVHVSSTVVLGRWGGTAPDLPLGDLDGPYSRSKIDSERVARGLQAAGAPVDVVYPGAVFGPHDPYRGDQSERLRWVARGLFPMWPRGGLHTVDVRDVAAVIGALLSTAGDAPGRRYVVPGHHVDAQMFYRVVSAVTGRRRRVVTPPDALMLAGTTVAGIAQRPIPTRWRCPADREGVEIAIRDCRFDDSPARVDLGVEPRPLEESLRDTLVWLVAAGRLSSRHAPALGSSG